MKSARSTARRTASALLALRFLAGCGCAALLPAVSSADALRPCDLYARGGTPCVAAFSTTRALYAAYDGPLYRVKRASDGAARNIRVLLSGYADAAAQDRFCADTMCEITVLYDQSPKYNNLTIEGPGGNGDQNVGVVAHKLRIAAGGQEAYGMYFEGDMGYRNNHPRGLARGGKAGVDVHGDLRNPLQLAVLL